VRPALQTGAVDTHGDSPCICPLQQLCLFTDVTIKLFGSTNAQMWQLW